MKPGSDQRDVQYGEGVWEGYQRTYHTPLPESYHACPISFLLVSRLVFISVYDLIKFK